MIAMVKVHESLSNNYYTASKYVIIFQYVDIMFNFVYNCSSLHTLHRVAPLLLYEKKNIVTNNVYIHALNLIVL